MKFLDLLPPEHVLVPLDAPHVRAAVEQLVLRLEESGTVRMSNALLDSVRTLPPRDIISPSDDVVLPHFRSDSVDSLTMALGISPEPIPSREPGLEVSPRIVALVLAPPDAASPYLQLTATLARLFRDKRLVDELARQPSPDAVRSMPQLQDLTLGPKLTVRDVMSHRVRAITPETSLHSATNLMTRRRQRAVPVVGQRGEVLGMVTESDLMRALLPQIPRVAADDAADGDILNKPVRDIMTRSVLCVSEDLDVSEVANMMIRKDVDQVPVVHAGSITGMVSRGDIIRKLFSRP